MNLLNPLIASIYACISLIKSFLFYEVITELGRVLVPDPNAIIFIYFYPFFMIPMDDNIMKSLELSYRLNFLVK